MPPDTSRDHLTSSVTQRAIEIAVAQVGKPYVWGAEGPNSFDCSGLLWYAFKQAGAKVGGRWTTHTMLASMQKIPVSAAMPGDFLFPHSGHVVMKINATQMVEAACTACGPVRIRSLKSRRWVFARRFANPGQGVNGGLSVGGSQTPLDGLPIIPDLIVMAKTLADTHFWLRAFTMGAGVVVLAVVVGRLGYGPLKKGVMNLASGNSDRSSGQRDIGSGGGGSVQANANGQNVDSGSGGNGSVARDSV